MEKQIQYFGRSMTKTIRSGGGVKPEVKISPDILAPCPIPKMASRRIDALRFLLVFMVVLIHTDLFASGFPPGVFEEGWACKWRIPATWFLRGMFGAFCGAIPLFFLFSGYLQTCTARPYPVLLKKRFRSLLIPYVFWMAVYVGCFIALKPVMTKVLPFWVSNPEATIQGYGIKDWVHGVLGFEYLGAGTFSTPGFAYSLWFLRDLMLLILVSPLFVFAIKRVPRICFAAVSVAYFMALPVGVSNTQSMFYYVAGLLWGETKFPLFETIDKVSLKGWVLLWGGAFVIAENWFGGRGPAQCAMVVLACAACLKLSSFLAFGTLFPPLFRRLSGFSFFVYVAHAPLLIEKVQIAWRKVLGVHGVIAAFSECVGVAATTIAFCVFVACLVRHFCPRAYAVMNGGRCG